MGLAISARFEYTRDGNELVNSLQTRLAHGARMNTPDNSDLLLRKAQTWWTTAIIGIEPGVITVRGEPIESLMGSVSFVEMIWLMLRGSRPSAAQARLLEMALVAGVDHGPQAPSIAIARMATTCGVELNSAMASAIGVLGDVHGGAGQQCMELFAQIRREVRDETTLAAIVDAALERFVTANGKIIPGYGHRFHPVDPRAEPLMNAVRAAAAEGAVSGQFVAIGREIEAGIQRRTGKPIPMNIDGATAVVFAELGFEPPLGRGLFVLSRSVGILAHAWEQMQQGGRNKGPMPREIPFTYSGPPRRTPGDK
jgi:citrate synthase